MHHRFSWHETLVRSAIMQPTANDEIFNKVVLAVEQTVYLQGHTLSPTTRLTDDLQLGRFGRVRLTIYLEETFDVEISDEAVEGFSTVGDIARYINRWSLENADFN
jgi:acyl carrier protein